MTTEDDWEEPYSYGDDDEPVETDVPEYACAYCGISDPMCVVQCVDTRKWFCNGRGISSASHAVQHFVRSRHHTVALHPDSPLGDTILECYCCGNRNVFLLGFIPVESSGVVVVVCREPCLSTTALKEMNCDKSVWQSLIEERMFLSWLVSNPSKTDVLKSRRITLQQIIELEDLWRTSPDATLLDLERVKGEDKELEPAKLIYEDGFELQSILSPLVELESENARIMKESQRKEGVSIRWERNLADHHVAMFSFPMRDDSEARLNPGDELKITLPHSAIMEKILLQTREYRHFVQVYRGTPNLPENLPTGKVLWCGRGNVMRVEDGEVHLEMRDNYVPEVATEDFIVDFTFSPISFDRMQSALLAFAAVETSVTSYLYHCLIGQQMDVQNLKVTLSTSYVAPSLPVLNDSQLNAVKAVLQKPLSLIQGPPGTGKTVTSATLVYHLRKQSEGQVLVCAPSNIAVDHLAEKIARTGLRVVRVMSKSRESMATSIDSLTLHHIVRNLVTPATEELQKLIRLKEEVGELSRADTFRYRRLLEKFEKEVLRAADVICTTCSGAGDRRLEDFTFRQVLIDEATQATEPECFIPIVKGAKQLILVGDHCQLGPVVISKSAANAGLTRSLFERLISLGVRPHRLQVQYRMHPSLSEFSSNRFYEGTLQNGVSSRERELSISQFSWPSRAHPMMFWSNNGVEEISASGSSFLNRSEAILIERLVTNFFKGGLNPQQIGIVTPYEGQRLHVVSSLTKTGSLRSELYKEVEVASVDSFQGREKDIIIVSCVRSNHTQGIGFLRDPRRLNVALTRAKYGVILIGNSRLLARNRLWYDLLSHYQERGCVVEGSLHNLTPILVPFPAPKSALLDDTVEAPADYANNYYANTWGDNPTQHNSATPAPVGDSESFSTNALYQMQQFLDPSFANDFNLMSLSAEKL